MRPMSTTEAVRQRRLPEASVREHMRLPSAGMTHAQRRAVVTGGASGIGRAICLRLARDGADIAVLDVNASGAEGVAAEVRELGRRAVAVETDVSRSEHVAAAVERVHAEL